ncbi:hypothetical protein [Catenibacillus scindens]|uniref:hypothetical protein n=1 Tax=Catenibacillus scindens TaxID=673271 RepID=UPI0032082302
MRELYQIWRVCLYHYSRWRGNWRVILSFGLGGVISFLLTENVVRFSQEYGLTMQIFEPFIWVFGDGTSILLVALAIILLFGDMPFLDGSVPYYLIRIRMRVWVGGQMIYLITSSLLYTFFILVMTMVFCFQNAFVGNMWSPTAAKLAYSGLADDYFIPAQLKTFEMVRPVECMITIFVLMLLYILVAVFVMYLATLVKNQAAGIGAAFIFHLYGFLLNVDGLAQVFKLSREVTYRASIWCGWLSPLRQATFPSHDFGYDRLPTLGNTYTIFGGAILVMAILVLWRMKYYSFYFSGGTQE